MFASWAQMIKQGIGADVTRIWKTKTGKIEYCDRGKFKS